MRARAVAALTGGAVRYDNVFKALEQVEPSVAERLSGSSSIVIKPDFFFARQGMSTSVDSVRAVLDFIGQFTNRKIAIAEGLYSGKEIQPAFHNALFHELREDYGLKYVDLNRDEFVAIRLGSDALSMARGSRLVVRVAKTVLNSDFRVSLAVPKLAGSRFSAATVNMAVGSVISRAKNDKACLLESRRFDAEIAELLEVVRPHLAVVDCFDFVVGNKSVEANLCVASADCVAADVTAAVALGKKLKRKVPRQGYLASCSRAGLGQSSLRKINVVGKM